MNRCSQILFWDKNEKNVSSFGIYEFHIDIILLSQRKFVCHFFFCTSFYGRRIKNQFMSNLEKKFQPPKMFRRSGSLALFASCVIATHLAIESIWRDNAIESIGGSFSFVLKIRRNTIYRSESGISLFVYFDTCAFQAIHNVTLWQKNLE